MYRDTKKVLEELIANNIELSIVYDIGANEGLWYTKWKSFLPGSSFYLFEANPYTLCRVPMSKEDTYNYAAFYKENNAKLEFFLPETTRSSTGVSYYKELTPYYGNKSIILDSITLDSFVSTYKIPTPDFIKLDTQGSEVDIIKGGPTSISKAKIILIEVPIIPYNMGAPNISEYIEVLRKLDFIPTGVEDIKIKNGVLLQMDLLFVRKDILASVHNFSHFLGVK